MAGGARVRNGCEKEEGAYAAKSLWEGLASCAVRTLRDGVWIEERALAEGLI